jgi:hypothetical protein
MNGCDGFSVNPQTGQGRMMQICGALFAIAPV